MSKYAPLAAFLQAQTQESVTLSFAQIDELVGGLPPSAREHHPWWGNSRTADTHSWAHLWIAAGWERGDLDLVGQTVTFVRIEANREAPVGPSFWWVNHKQTHRVELVDGYIWSPKEKKNGARNQAYINLTLVRPGDVVFSYAETVIKAIGVAKSRYSEQPKPGGYGPAGESWNDHGWQVPIDWLVLEKPIRPKDQWPDIEGRLPAKYSPLQANGDGNQSVYLASISADLGGLLLQLGGPGASAEVLRRSRLFTKDSNFGRSKERLPAEQLRLVTPRHVWQAVQDILNGVEVPGFGPSTDYDLVTDDGDRLPPKTVFGLAATYALGFQVLPKHFTAGVDTPCFTSLLDAGYLIVAKGEDLVPIGPEVAQADRVWAEGRTKLTTHLRRERGAGLSRAKKDDFIQQHGRLYCEHCLLDPDEVYGEAGAACIEVHHREVQVSNMAEGHRTRLEDLQCLCANCHRVEHRRLKLAVLLGEAVPADAAVAE